MSEKNIVQNEVNNSNIDVISSPASTSTPGVAYFNPEDFTVDSDGYVSSRQKVGAIQYIGTIIKEGDSSLIWNITRDISPKKLSDVKLNDLVLLAEDYGDYEAGLVFAVSALIYPELQTKKTAEFSIRGSVGDTGPKGETGQASTIEVGKTTTLNAGEFATVVNSGDEHNAIFEFSIPRGELGPGFEIKYHVDLTDDLPEPTYDNCGDVYSVGEGEAPYDVWICEWMGDTYEWVNHGPLHGPKGDPATVDVYETITTEPGTDAEVANVTGDNNNVQLQFKIPRGTPATVKVVKTETIDPSEDARVVDVNSSENDAEFEFYIPRGKTGEIGYVKMNIIDGELYCNSYGNSVVEGFKLNKYGELLMEVTV